MSATSPPARLRLTKPNNCGWTLKNAEVAMAGMMLPEVDPSAVSGNIIAAGSSTVYPLAEAHGRALQGGRLSEDKGKITIDSIGSGAGFERFCKTGETDIANASRKIKDSEIENCARPSAARPIEFRIGTDALAVVVSQRERLPHRRHHWKSWPRSSPRTPPVVRCATRLAG